MNSLETGTTLFLTEIQGEMSGLNWSPYTDGIVYAKGLFPQNEEHATPLIVQLNPMYILPNYMISRWEASNAVVEKSPTFNLDKFSPVEVSRYLAIRNRSN